MSKKPQLSAPRTRSKAGRAPAFALALLALVALLLAPSVAAQSARSAPRASQPDLAAQRMSTSADWSGYATTGATYSSVAGGWTQPAVTCSAGETSYSAFWVGLDGDTTKTVEQIGTESDCAQGAPVYAAWYEMYPAAPVTIAQPVAPGDHLTAAVTANGSGGFTLTLADATQGWSFSTQATADGAQLGSAEWIAEAPSNGRRALPLANFGTVTFTACAANGAAISASPNVDAITLASRAAGIEAQPSGLAANGASFSVTTQTASSSGAGTGASPFPTQPFPTQPFPGGRHHHWHYGM